MVHPQVLRNCGIDPSEYSGFAFGAGADRIAVRVQLGFPAQTAHEDYAASIADALKQETGAADVSVEFSTSVVAHPCCASHSALAPTPPAISSAAPGSPSRGASATSRGSG